MRLRLCEDIAGKVLIWMTTIKTYSELITLPTFEERFNYLQLNGSVGKETFGYDRIFNQRFYTSLEWRNLRHHIIVRDNACDLACKGYEIPKGQPIFIHHINPILLEDIENNTDILMNPEFLITTTFPTHQAIHYGGIDLLTLAPIERKRNDTCPWRK